MFVFMFMLSIVSSSSTNRTGCSTVCYASELELFFSELPGPGGFASSVQSVYFSCMQEVRDEGFMARYNTAVTVLISSDDAMRTKHTYMKIRLIIMHAEMWDEAV
jgi:hypothetical protein